MQLERLKTLLLEGPEAYGFPTPLWTCPRVARLASETSVERALPRWPCLEDPMWALNWSPQRPVGQARERNEARHPLLSAEDLPGH